MGAVFAAPVQRHKLTGRGFQYLRSLHSLFIGVTGKAMCNVLLPCAGHIKQPHVRLH
jgi:hypothetical protein